MRKANKLELQKRLAALGDKIVHLTYEIKRFGPRQTRRGFRVFYYPRNGMIRNWYDMAIRSLIATRKKVYKLKQELDSL